MANLVHVKKAAVLGAGVMGAQIAAHFANAGIETFLFDLSQPGEDKNALTHAAIKRLGKLKPAPLADASRSRALHPANYEDNLEHLQTCDIVIEAIGEKLEWKQELYKRIGAHLKPGAILASNTSGLSLQTLAKSLPEDARAHFCGIHFFNPPRYMRLVEVTPTHETDPDSLAKLEAFVTSHLGKSVVFARDTPNFIGNRIGVFSILSTLKHTQTFGLDFAEVDELTGQLIGRPKSATYRTADVVGLDTLKHVVDNMAATLAEDPWHDSFNTPAWLDKLIENGALGQKSGAGIYRKEGKDIKVLDIETHTYRARDHHIKPEIKAILEIKDAKERFCQLHQHQDPQAQFLWACWRDLFHYSAYHLAAIATTTRDIDLAMRWGYGWKQGPFETWQAAGWQQILSWIEQDIDNGKALSTAQLPDWVGKQDAVYTPKGAYAPAQDSYQARSKHPVYARQLFPELMLGETHRATHTLWENDGIKLWTCADDAIGIMSFKTKMHTINDAVLDGIQQAIDYAEEHLRALVLWQTGTPFSAGADLKGALALLQNGQSDQFASMIANFQATSMRIKYAQVPFVSAIRGLALGGGCEFQLHSAHTVATLESYIGLVEAGVGLLPSGGGLKELALRASLAAFGNPFDNLKRAFETTAMAKVSSSALEAKKLGLLRPSDTIVMHEDELLYVAKQQANALAEANYRPPLPAKTIAVAGRPGTATFKAQLVNMLEGHFISAHDMHIASAIADTLCGGDIERGSEVNEAWFLNLERRHFIELAQTPKTQERIAHTMQTGKPLRN